MKVLLISPNINGINRIQPPLGIPYLKENYDVNLFNDVIKNRGVNLQLYDNFINDYI